MGACCTKGEGTVDTKANTERTPILNKQEDDDLKKPKKKKKKVGKIKTDADETDNETDDRYNQITNQNQLSHTTNIQNKEYIHTVHTSTLLHAEPVHLF